MGRGVEGQDKIELPCYERGVVFLNVGLNVGLSGDVCGCQRLRIDTPLFIFTSISFFFSFFF